MSEQKVALVTGGSRGIGRAIARALTDEGCKTAILYAGNEQAAQETLNAGDAALAIRCDVTDYEQVEAAVKRIKSELGAVDVLVNNAGITKDALAMRMPISDFTDVLGTNLTGAFHLIRATMPDFVRRRSGRIINITSVSGLMGNAGQANYSAAKAGLVGLTKSIAKEIAGRGITVNAIAPGFIETDMTANMNQVALEEAVSAVPLGRMGEAREIANAVVFLASEGAGYITGAVLQVDGGLYM